VVATYSDLSPHGQHKFVADGDERTWEEVEKATTLYRSAGVEFPVYIMPVGGLVEHQEFVAGNIADQAIARGYCVFQNNIRFENVYFLCISFIP
jgi:hypothetical protein